MVIVGDDWLVEWDICLTFSKATFFEINRSSRRAVFPSVDIELHKMRAFDIFRRDYVNSSITWYSQKVKLTSTDSCPKKTPQTIPRIV